MFKNYLAAALRNLARNGLYSVLSIFGLATGLCAAIIAGLIVRNELTYDRFIPGYEKTYLVASSFTSPNQTLVYNDLTRASLAAQLKTQFGEIKAVSRLAEQEVRLQLPQQQQRIGAPERIYWADPNAFEVLTLPVFRGNLASSLQRPDGLVLPRSVSRKYFGRDDSIGETLQLNNRPMTVTAVIEDLPRNSTHLVSGIFASGLFIDSQVDHSSSTGLASLNPDSTLHTYIKVNGSRAAEQVQKALPSIMDRIVPKNQRPPNMKALMKLIRVDKVHLSTELVRSSSDPLASKSDPGIRTRITITAVIGALILLIACINFVNLATARLARRAREVGVRKAAGAGRDSLMVQFLGESLLYVVLAAVIAIGMAKLLLPWVNAFLNFGATFDYGDPDLIAWTCMGILVVGVLAGAYPAFILSAFHPVAVLRGLVNRLGGAIARQILVTMQFGILIGLIIATGVVYQQLIFAQRDALRVDSDQILIVKSGCTEAFKNELRTLRGVRGAACTSPNFMINSHVMFVPLKGGGSLPLNLRSGDTDTFDLYGIKPVAGRLFVDKIPSSSGEKASTPGMQAVVNETTVRRLGFSSPNQAIGYFLFGEGAGEIIGVVPDFTLGSVQEEITPMAYFPGHGVDAYTTIKLTGHFLPETLSSIEHLWQQTGVGQPFEQFFLSDYIQKLYVGMLREAQLFSMFSGIAILLACLGLVGLSASIAENRTKEIGIRKALGADARNVVGLVLWQFAKPVLWANLIVWPVAAWLMMRWLQGFAYHVDLDPLLFAGATALTLIIALLTVSTHAILISRTNPVEALRHE